MSPRDWFQAWLAGLAAAATGDTKALNHGTNAGGQLRYHGDFDWPGIGIAAAVIRRHGARPWRLGAADYRAAIAAGADYVKLDGTLRPTPWDPPLTGAMTEAARAVYEESVTAPLIDDLRGSG